ncbi:MAG: response regulator [Fimbriimonadaceae bacterium]|nr:response regulator [Fimbriimonadaceae bacterium]
MKAKVVLLVEDSADDEMFTLRAFRRALNLTSVVVARDGEEAVGLLFGEEGRQGARPDLILLDLKVPKLDGFEVLRLIRQNDRLKLVPVVIMSSSGEEHDVDRSYSLGANSYIRKPIGYESYQDAIRQIGTYWLGLNFPQKAAE